MRDMQTALAICIDDTDIERDFYCKPDSIHTYETPDDTYVIYYWHWQEQPFDKKILVDRRHALVSFSDDDYLTYDIVDTDSRGEDEEFWSIFNWQLAIDVFGKTLNSEYIYDALD